MWDGKKESTLGKTVADAYMALADKEVRISNNKTIGDLLDRYAVEVIPTKKPILKETKIRERFTEHDLRAKVGSDAESLERAQQLLAHADSSTTKRIYRRKIEAIKPTK